MRASRPSRTRRHFVIAPAIVAMTGLAGLQGCVALVGFAQGELLRALLDRLDRESALALQRLGLPGGFALDPRVRLVLPPGVLLVRHLLVVLGLGPQVLALERQLNATAEEVAAAAQPVVHALLPLLPWQQQLAPLIEGRADPVQVLRRLATDELRERLVPLATDAAQRTGLDRTWTAVQAAIRPVTDIRQTDTRAIVIDTVRQAAEQAEPPEVRQARRQLNDIRQSVDQAVQLDLGDARRWVADQVVEALFIKLHQAFDADPWAHPLQNPVRREPAPVEDALPRKAGL